MPSFFTWVLEIWTYCPYPLNHFPSPWLLLGFQMSGTLFLQSLRVNTALTEWCFPICKDLISLLLWGRWFFSSALDICSRGSKNLEMSWLPSQGPELTLNLSISSSLDFLKYFTTVFWFSASSNPKSGWQPSQVTLFLSSCYFSI